MRRNSEVVLQNYAEVCHKTGNVYPVSRQHVLGLSRRIFQVFVVGTNFINVKC
jgi:hypothetical protein